MSTYNYEILPTYRNDRIIENWDYDENGRWGIKQYINCWICLIFCFVCEILFFFWLANTDFFK